jgi:hypothetical protein
MEKSIPSPHDLRLIDKKESCERERETDSSSPSLHGAQLGKSLKIDKHEGKKFIDKLFFFQFAHPFTAE